MPADLRHRFNEKKVEVSLRTKSEVKAAKSAAALSDRLERYWDSLRMEQIHLKELGLTVTNQFPVISETNSVSIDIDESFYKNSSWRSLFLINLSYGDTSKLHPRGNRLSFEQAC